MSSKMSSMKIMVNDTRSEDNGMCIRKDNIVREKRKMATVTNQN